MLGISLELDANRTLKLAQDSAQPNNAYEFEILMTGGHRNRLTQPVRYQLAVVDSLYSVSLLLVCQNGISMHADDG